MPGRLGYELEADLEPTLALESPHEAVQGVLRVRTRDTLSGHRLRVSLRCQVRRGDITETETHDEQVLREGDWGERQLTEHPFSLVPPPQGPYSYRGSFVRVEWAVVAELRSMDLSDRLGLTTSPVQVFPIEVRPADNVPVAFETFRRPRVSLAGALFGAGPTSLVRDLMSLDPSPLHRVAQWMVTVIGVGVSLLWLRDAVTTTPADGLEWLLGGFGALLAVGVLLVTLAHRAALARVVEREYEARLVDEDIEVSVQYRSRGSVSGLEIRLTGWEYAEVGDRSARHVGGTIESTRRVFYDRGTRWIGSSRGGHSVTVRIPAPPAGRWRWSTELDRAEIGWSVEVQYHLRGLPNPRDTVDIAVRPSWPE